MICQVHANTCVAAKTVPILNALRLRGGPREQATSPRMAAAEIDPVAGVKSDWTALRSGTNPAFVTTARLLRSISAHSG